MRRHVLEFAFVMLISTQAFAISYTFDVSRAVSRAKTFAVGKIVSADYLMSTGRAKTQCRYRYQVEWTIDQVDEHVITRRSVIESLMPLMIGSKYIFISDRNLMSSGGNDDVYRGGYDGVHCVAERTTKNVNVLFPSEVYLLVSTLGRENDKFVEVYWARFGNDAAVSYSFPTCVNVHRIADIIEFKKPSPVAHFTYLYDYVLLSELGAYAKHGCE